MFGLAMQAHSKSVADKVPRVQSGPSLDWMPRERPDFVVGGQRQLLCGSIHRQAQRWK